MRNGAQIDWEGNGKYTQAHTHTHRAHTEDNKNDDAMMNSTTNYFIVVTALHKSL